MQVPDGRLEDAVRGLSCMPNIGGLLVTMPHKFKAHEFCATFSDTSRLLKAVSLMRRNRDGSWHGDMLDGLAFVKAQRAAGAVLEGARGLLIGAGGAGSAMAIALLDSGIGHLTISDHDRKRVDVLISILSSNGYHAVDYGPPDPTGYELVFNATPMGMAKDDPLPVSPHLLTSSMFVGDVIAGHGETSLVRAARSAGCRTANGDQMAQAVLGMMVDFLLGA